MKIGMLMKSSVAQSEEGGGGGAKVNFLWLDFDAACDACSGCFSRLCWLFA